MVVSSFKTVRVLGYDVLDQPLPSLLSCPSQVVIDTFNPHSYVVAKSDLKFQMALHNADILVADGIGVVMASLVQRRQTIHRITGPDVFESLMQQLESVSGRCFFLGSTAVVLDLIKEKLTRKYPRVAIRTYSPPFVEQFVDDDIARMSSEINEFRPDVLFLGLTAPKQEKLAHDLRSRVSSRVIAPVGALFDAVAGTRPRAPLAFRRAGLEWLYRLMRQPRRLWRRTVISAPLFLFDVLAASIKRGDSE